MQNLKKVVPLFQGKKILVFGDLMLDEHIWSSVNRISPEAPVPIAEVNKITHVPGGSGNVAVNIAALGGIPILFGLIGKDSSAEKLLKALKEFNVSGKYLIKDHTRPTILKSRIIAASQQVVRVDREDKNKLSQKAYQNIIKKAVKLIKKADAVIISDYGKGLVTKETCQAMITACQKANKIVAIDPKGRDYSKYKGATILTPNLKEASLAANIEINSSKDLLNTGKTLLNATRTKHLLITRGKEGLSLFSADDVTHISAIAKEIFDVSGAGDTVIATITLAATTGIEMKHAASLGNTAASIVVAKIGTAPCFRFELEEALDEHEPTVKKIKTAKEIEVITKNLRNQDAKIVFTNGCFDILHLGHARYLREAKKLGDILIVGLNSDLSVRKLKGAPRPYVPELERAEILASLTCVDYVVIFSQLRPDDLISLIKPDVHVKGGDYKITQLPEKRLVESFGGKVVVIPPIKDRSTTNLVAKILGKI